ncbi:MAG: DinB family protein [Bacteroidota bacterium]
MQTNSQNELLVKMIITAWQGQNKKLDELIAKLSDEQWNADTAPGRNSGTYLLGHLVAVNDGMIKLLGFGEKTHPELEAPFLANPDKSGQNFASLADLKKYWNEINTKLDESMKALSTDDWFGRHMSISEEDFCKEPHRNKLSILISRTAHQAYHLGQLAYLS